MPGSGIEEVGKRIRRRRRSRETCEKDKSGDAKSQMTGHGNPGVAPPGTTFGRDLGHNAAQIRQRGGFILARKRDTGLNAARQRKSNTALRSSSSLCRTNSPDVEYRKVMLSMPIDRPIKRAAQRAKEAEQEGARTRRARDRCFSAKRLTCASASCSQGRNGVTGGPNRECERAVSAPSICLPRPSSALRHKADTRVMRSNGAAKGGRATLPSLAALGRLGCFLIQHFQRNDSGSNVVLACP